MLWRVLSVVLSFAALTSGCGDSVPSPARGPFAVGTRQVTFVDDDRPTPSFGGQPERPERTVVTDLWYPAEGTSSGKPQADAPPADGPFPLVVFNHGQQGEPQQYTASLELWARAGYVIAAPRHPLTVRGGPGAHFVDDVQGVIGDIPFVVDRMAHDEQVQALGADTENVAVIGHSSGALATLAVGTNSCCRLQGVDAIALEAVTKFPLDGEYFADDDPPLLFLHGDADGAFPIGVSKNLYANASSPKLFLTIHGGAHSDTFRQQPYVDIVSESIVLFLDAYVKDRSDALAELRKLAERSPRAELQVTTD